MNLLQITVLLASIHAVSAGVCCFYAPSGQCPPALRDRDIDSSAARLAGWVCCCVAANTDECDGRCRT
ncbi:hypothetical protein PsYK624_171700 [Phanerochaete sordida]|uniref:Uncharacterized protein n=1 Tax=Phanerochaete sordida TaxID=48140 RepID=A0A9P3GSR0_9APHY|nr:hypothetical protein PsYK624_171700 [Phanerochaete sordida]